MSDIPFEKLRDISQSQPYPLLFTVIYGSQAFGFSSQLSDYDLAGVHILPLHEVVGLYAPKDTLEKKASVDGTEVSLTTHDVTKFFDLILKRNGHVLEQILSPLIVASSQEHEELKALVPACMTRHHAHHYVGFSRAQFGIFADGKSPTIKPILHAYRILLTGIHLMRTGQIEIYLPTLADLFQLSYIPEWIERKLMGGNRALVAESEKGFFTDEYKRLVTEIDRARDATHLPANVDVKPALNDLLLRVRGLTF